MAKKRTKSNFEILCDLKVEMKSFMKKEESMRREMDLAYDDKEYNKFKKKLNNHKQSFKALEKELVERENKMINLERGLYKGIAIDVKDKEYKKIPLYLKFLNLANHVGYFGTTRVGKTKNMISDADQLIKEGWDVIIVDPKGGEGQEILSNIQNSCMKANRLTDFKYLSPAFPKESEHVNLLFGLEDDEGASLIRTFAESVSDDGFFTGVVFQNTLAVLKSLSYIQAATDPTGKITSAFEKKELEKYLNFNNTGEEEQIYKKDSVNNVVTPNILNYLHLERPIKNKRADFKTSGITTSFYQNRSMVTFQTLSNFTTYKSLQNLKKSVESEIHIPGEELIGTENYKRIETLKREALTILDNVLDTDEKNFAKISKTHSVLLTQLAFGDIGEVFSGVGINVLVNRLLNDDEGLVCVMQPYPMKYSNISDMSVMALLKSIESMMGMVGTSGRANKRRLAIMIDEAGSVMYKDISNLFNKAGGLGVSMFVYSQSYEDYVLKLDKSSAKVINDNINTPITMRMNDPESCKIAAEALGSKRTHKSMYMSQADGGGRFSVGSEDEPVALPEDIAELDIAMGYIRHNGEIYIVDFPYVKGLENNILQMPELKGESIRRELAKYETTLKNIQHGIKEIHDGEVGENKDIA